MAVTLMLADDPVYAFTPAYDPEAPAQQILMVFDGMTGHAGTSLIALSIGDAERLCDRLNTKLGLDRRAWSRIAARAMPGAHTDRSPPQ